MTEDAYIEANCKNCGSRGFLRDGTWFHTWGSHECEKRQVFEPDFYFNRK